MPFDILGDAAREEIQFLSKVHGEHTRAYKYLQSHAFRKSLF